VRHYPSYRPDIDGLRAIAILSVVFYHAGLGCPGGYVGVDVFFVISGFLITSLILKDLREGKFSLVGFWERRLRRIFPALAATVLVTLVAGWFLLLPEHLENLGKSTVAQSLLSANIYFWRTDNYFGGANEDKPLLHTWSLAVEEQFYLFFPLILIFLFSRTQFRRPRIFIGTLLAGLVVSLVVAVWGVKHQPYATFYLLPTRAWELLCGALVAGLPATMFLSSRPVREGASWLGLLCIFLPVCRYDDNTPFPGMAAMPPCLGTALLIWANTPVSSSGLQSQSRTLPASMLSLRAVAFIGLISYSLYLWHWPVMALSSYWKTAPFSFLMRCGLVVLSLALAVFSWSCVETPFRAKKICETRGGIFGFTTVTTFILFLMGWYVVSQKGLPGRIPPQAFAILSAAKMDDKARYQFINLDKNISSADEIKDNGLPRFGSNNPYAPVEVMLWGDSHAGRAIPVFDSLCKRFGIAGRAAIVYSTAPLVNMDYHLRQGSKDAIATSSAVVDYIKANRIPNTFLFAYWSDYERVGGADELEKSLVATIQALKATDTKVWVFLDCPDYDNDVTKTLVRKIIFPKIPWPESLCSPDEHRSENIALYNLSTNASTTIFIDPSPLLLDPAKGVYKIIDGGVPLYSDNNHLTLHGAELALLPLLQPIFEKELRPPQLASSAKTSVLTP
jgi:peptidoglycan/LPS O-acetylase OafA/YrhL